MSEFQKDELSLEETNRLRAQLGLKPLLPDSDDEGEQPGKSSVAGEDDISDPLKNQDEKAARNYAAHQEAARKKREEDSVAERIAKARNRRDLNRKLQGPTLGEAGSSDATASGDSNDTKKWLKAQRKRAKELAEKRQREEEEVETAALANVVAYEGKDLRGLRVGHDLDDLGLEEGGEERILTLRDSTILDGDEDELMDTALDEAERDRRNEERKKGPKKYTGLDDAEFANGRAGEKRSVLSKYDDDIELAGGSHRDVDVGFTLGANNTSKADRVLEKRRETERTLNRPLLDLDYTKNEEISDYLQEGDVGFKKPKSGKKKKRQAASRIKLDDDEDGEIDSKAALAHTTDIPMQVDSQANRITTDLIDDVVDDDDLARSLAAARRKQAKRTFHKITPEMIAQNLAAQRAAEEAEESVRARRGEEAGAEDTKPSSSGLVFDETSEFVRNLQKGHETTSPATPAQNGRPTMIKQEDGEQNSNFDTYAENRVNGTATSDVKQEDDEGEDEVMEDEPDHVNGKDLPTGFDAAEPLVSGGIASTLSLLKNQGLVAQMTPEEREREVQQRKHDLWLSQRRSEDALREAELALSKAQGSAKDQAQREHDNRLRELEDAKLAQARFKDYRPDVEIKYHDEFGRELNNHEAWKRLSHVFHGKAPGKKKQEKRLQRIEDEKRREKMLSGDTPTGMSKAFSERAERSGQAHMIIGVGARNNAPQDAALLQPSTSKAQLAKGKKRSDVERSTDVEVAPAVGGDARSDTQSSVNGITSMVPRSTLPKNKANFIPVKRANASALLGATSATSSPAPPNKFKLAFGKRPAVSAPDTSSKQRRLDHE